MRAPKGEARRIFLEMQATQTDECVRWPYGKSDGYGQLHGPRHTHSLSCEISHGPPPPGAHALHSCRNRDCFNPRHLRWGTPTENQADRIRDHTDNRGTRNGAARLTEFDVRAIRHYVGCGTKQRVLVDHYGVSPMCISQIITGRTWGWLV